MGLYFAGSLATLAAIGVLSAFRWVEARTPTMHFARLSVRFKRTEHLVPDDLRALAARHHIDSARPSHHLEDEGRTYRYDMTVRTRDPVNFGLLSETLSAESRVVEFAIEPTGD